jgi:hypothetical protein
MPSHQSFLQSPRLRCNCTVRITAAGTYSLPSEYSISSRVLITGASAPGPVTLVAGKRGNRHFSVSVANANLTLVGLTLARAFHNGTNTRNAVGTMIMFRTVMKVSLRQLAVTGGLWRQ